MGIAATWPLVPPSSRRLLLCLSHLRWGFVFQRPQHLLRRAAARYDVLFFEEPFREMDAQPSLRMNETPEGVYVIQPVLGCGLSAEQEAVILQSLLTALLARSGRRVDVLWYYTPMALAFSRLIKADVVVYDNMDELSAFRGAPEGLIRLEADLMNLADIVFTGGHSLYEAKRHRHDNIHAFPSSVDAAHFAKARMPQPIPADMAGIAGPRIGFFGVIDERMDLALVDGIAQRRPDWQIVMIGPVAKIDPASLPRRPNIHWLGGKSYDELPAYLAHWDAGFMPFALNEATRYISPTKTPEFLAASLPVASTSIRDVVRPYGELGLVAIADTADAMTQALGQQLSTPRDLWRSRVNRLLRTMSWDNTWAGMAAQITAASRRQPLVAGPLALTPEASHV